MTYERQNLAEVVGLQTKLFVLLHAGSCLLDRGRPDAQPQPGYTADGYVSTRRATLIAATRGCDRPPISEPVDSMLVWSDTYQAKKLMCYSVLMRC
jgi:hypothetical protein